MKICVYTKTCTSLFVAALFAIAGSWKQPRCPSAGEWKHCSVFTQVNTTQQEKGMDYWYMHQLAWILETSRTVKKAFHKSTYRMIPLYSFRAGTSNPQQEVIWRVLSLGERGGDQLGGAVKNLPSDNVIYLIGVLLTQVSTCVKTQQILGYHHPYILRESWTLVNGYSSFGNEGAVCALHWFAWSSTWVGRWLNSCILK